MFHHIEYAILIKLLGYIYFEWLQKIVTFSFYDCRKLKLGNFKLSFKTI